MLFAQISVALGACCATAALGAAGRARPLLEETERAALPDNQLVRELVDSIEQDWGDVQSLARLQECGEIDFTDDDAIKRFELFVENLESLVDLVLQQPAWMMRANDAHSTRQVPRWVDDRLLPLGRLLVKLFNLEPDRDKGFYYIRPNRTQMGSLFVTTLLLRYRFAAASFVALGSVTAYMLEQLAAMHHYRYDLDARFEAKLRYRLGSAGALLQRGSEAALITALGSQAYQVENVIRREPVSFKALIDKLIERCRSSALKIGLLLPTAAEISTERFMSINDYFDESHGHILTIKAVPTIESLPILLTPLFELVEADDGALLGALNTLRIEIDRSMILFSKSNSRSARALYEFISNGRNANRESHSSPLSTLQCALSQLLKETQDWDHAEFLPELHRMLAAAVSVESASLSGGCSELKHLYAAMNGFVTICNRHNDFLQPFLPDIATLLCDSPEKLSSSPVAESLGKVQRCIRDCFDVYLECLEAINGAKDASVRLHLLAQILRVRPWWYATYHYLESLMGPPEGYQPLPEFDFGLLSVEGITDEPLHVAKRASQEPTQPDISI
jgi:hypothetical protein